MAKRGEYIDWLKIYQSKLHLTKKSNGYTALCPYHDDKNPSFSIMANGNFKCFSCGEGGSVYKFIKDFELKEIKTTNLITELPQKETVIEFSEKSFTKEAHKYWNSFCLETMNSKQHDMPIENDRTMDALPEASVFLIALILDGFFKNEGIQAPREEEDPHMAHLMGFAEICYN